MRVLFKGRMSIEIAERMTHLSKNMKCYIFGSLTIAVFGVLTSVTVCDIQGCVNKYVLNILAIYIANKYFDSYLKNIIYLKYV